jgi:hypothetical protein
MLHLTTPTTQTQSQSEVPKTTPTRPAHVQGTLVRKGNTHACTTMHIPLMVLLVRPLLQSDMYQVCARRVTTADTEANDADTNAETGVEYVPLGLAHVPNYMTSQLLFRLFRQTQHTSLQSHLSSLEDSDDEHESESVAMASTLVSHTVATPLPMQCKYNTKFKKWCPLQVVSTPTVSVASVSELATFGLGTTMTNTFRL